MSEYKGGPVVTWRNWIQVFSVCAATIGLAACSNAPDSRQDGRDRADAVQRVAKPAQAASIREAGNDLAFRLLASAAADDSRNAVVSPLSLGMTLDMLANGAEVAAGTQRRLLTARGFDTSMDIDTVNDANRELIDSLTTPSPGVSLELANAIWTSPGIEPDEKVARVVRSFYHGELTALDDDPEIGTREVNAWAARNTRGRITQIAQPDDLYPGGVAIPMLLANAMAFTGRWSDPFAPDETRADVFRAEAAMHKVQMMSDEKPAAYLAVPGDTGFVAARLPYGRDRRWGLYVMVPNRDTGLADVLASLSGASWRRWHDQFAREPQVLIELPRMKLRMSRDLMRDLDALGVPREDYRGLIRDAASPYAIAAAKQDTYLKIDEQGTKAAAVTTIGVVATAVPTQHVEQREVIADHPYVLLLVDDVTGSIAMACAIRQPNEESPA